MSFNHLINAIITPVIAYIPNSDAYSLLALIVAGITGIGSFFIFFFGDANKKKVLGSTFAVIFVLGGGIFVWLRFFNPPPPPPHVWSNVLQEFAPGCTSPESGTWANDSTSSSNNPITCDSYGLLMKRLSSLNGAEEDLSQVNGKGYSQTQFRVQVDIRFQSTTADGDTVAGLIFQTPPSPGTGGYIFGLNNTGYWALKSVPTTQGQDETTVRSGYVHIDPSQLILLEVDVQNGMLTSSINGQPLIDPPYPDTLNPSSAVVGLLVEWVPNGQTSVRFTSFKLDQ